MESPPSVGLHRQKPGLEGADSDHAQEETLKGFLLYFWGKGWGRDTGAGSVLLGSMTTPREGREHSQPSGLNYLLTQIIKFQGPHCSGATQAGGGRPRPEEQVAAELEREVQNPEALRGGSVAHRIVGSFSWLTQGKASKMFILIRTCWIATHLVSAGNQSKQLRNIWLLTLDSI